MPSWTKDLSTTQLFRLLKGDMKQLRNGSWVPDADSVDCTVDVVKEIERRMKKLEKAK